MAFLFFSAPYRRGRLLRYAILPLLTTIPAAVLRADSATWLSIPPSNEWVNSADWTPTTIPNGAGQVATFGVSTKTSVTVASAIEVGSIVFSAGASSYAFKPETAAVVTISGAGVINNSASAQSFEITGTSTSGSAQAGMFFRTSANAGGSSITYTADAATAAGTPRGAITFSDYASAGSSNLIARGAAFALPSSGGNGNGMFYFLNNATAQNANVSLQAGLAADGAGGTLAFYNTSTAGNATINAAGAAVSTAYGSQVDFLNSASAGNSSITLGAGKNGGDGGNAQFFSSSTAGNSTITAQGSLDGDYGAEIIFGTTASAGSATLIAGAGSSQDAGGIIIFQRNAQGGTARIELFSGSSLDVSEETTGSVLTIGSLEGTGLGLLGAQALAIGSNNLSTTFSGSLQDGGLAGGTGGSLTKVGSGTLILSGANTYTGTTTVSSGQLQLDGSIGSATTVANGGKLSGTGTQRGGLSIASGGTLAPGDNGQGTLTASSVSLDGGSTLQFTLGPKTDFLHVLGNLRGTSSTPVNVFLTDAGVQAGQTYPLFDEATVPSNDSTNFPNVTYTTSDGFTGVFVLGSDAYGTEISFLVQSVPEPSGAALLGGGGMALALRRLRRSRQRPG